MTQDKYANLNDLILERWLRLRNEDKIKWKTIKGDEISIRRLSDEHLEHAITCCKKALDIEDEDTGELFPM